MADKGQKRESAAMLTRRDFLKAAGMGTLALTMGSGLSLAQGLDGLSRKPNIVLILADDLGYGELSVQGSKDISTPNIDKIAANGVRFTNGYVSCPVCSPTRAGLMTGRYQQRFGHEFNPGPGATASDVFGLSLQEKTLAERLRPMGYATGIFGKWHLGFKPEYLPLARGFEEFYGFPGGAHDYLQAQKDKNNPIYNGKTVVKEIDYTTDAFTREAVSFIERHKDQPFFLYLPYNAVHAPLEATQPYLDRTKLITDRKRHTFAAMQTAMDDGVGKVMGKLRELGLEEHTLVIFLSDNGGPTPSTTSRNDPLRGFKGQVLEGGIRVPFMMQWKGRIPAGKVYDQPVISLDIHPTALVAAGGEVAPEMKLDGVNLVPYLTGDAKGAPHDRLYWRFGDQWAIRQGDWKLEGMKPGEQKLYNLAEDIGESKDLADKNPDKVKEMKAAWDAWNAQLVPPKWKRAPGPKQMKARRRRRKKQVQ